LTASPASGSTFVGWTGACTGLSCTVTMETNKIVSAQFDLLPVFVTLTVNTSGPVTARSPVSQPALFASQYVRFLIWQGQR
jgi:hypothetical protein